MILPQPQVLETGVLSDRTRKYDVLIDKLRKVYGQGTNQFAGLVEHEADEVLLFY